MELAVLWLVVWFLGIWVLPWLVGAIGISLAAILDNDWSILVLILAWIGIILAFGFAVYQFVLQIISVVSLVT